MKWQRGLWFLLSFLRTTSGFSGEKGQPVGGLTPFFFRNSLVAGSSDAAYLDGSFIKASFRFPQGLALARDSKRLYVADTGNDAVRVVDLERQNRVSTLARLSVSAATGQSLALSAPAQVIALADGSSLLVLDQSQSPLKLINLKSGLGLDLLHALSPSTEAKSPITSMAMDTKGKRLYFLRQPIASLECIDLQDYSVHVISTAPELAQGLKLATNSLGLFGFNNSDGSIYRMVSGAEALAGPHYAPLSYTSQVTLSSIGPKVPKGAGFTAFEDQFGGSYLMLWDPAVGGLRTVDMSGGSSVNYFCNTAGEPLSGYDHSTATAQNTVNYFLGPLDTVVLPGARAAYVLECQSHRILRVAGNADSYYAGYSSDYFMGEKSSKAVPKEPGVTRILWLGSSETYWPGSAERANPSYYLSAQFEYYLNLFSALKGTGKKYEVVSAARSADAFGGSTASFLLGTGNLVDLFKPDEVMVCLSSKRYINEFNALARTRTVDDIATPSIDSTWVLTSAEERRKSWGPLTKELHQLLKDIKDPDVKHGFYFDENDELQGGLYPAVAANPEIKAITVKFMAKLFGKGAEFGRLHHVKVKYCMLPVAYNVSGGEVQKSYYGNSPPIYLKETAETIRAAGLTFIDVVSEIKLISPAAFPIFAAGEDAHATYNGQRQEGFALAWNYLADEESRHE